MTIDKSKPTEPAGFMDHLSSAERKRYPMYQGLLAYFPDALAYVAHVSFVANEQHNPGEPIRWAKDKSIGVGDEIIRHLIDKGKTDTDKLRHSGKLAWRALELLQREIEAEKAARPAGDVLRGPERFGVGDSAGTATPGKGK